MSSKSWTLWLLIITVVVRLPTMFGVKRTGWDERAYVVFAQTLDKSGVSGIRQWMHDYPTNESLQRSPLLLRVGFIVPAMLTCKILGGFNPDNLAWLSFACGVGLVLLGARFAENISGRRMSILCGILLITSPVAAGLSRPLRGYPRRRRPGQSAPPAVRASRLRDRSRRPPCGPARPCRASDPRVAP